MIIKMNNQDDIFAPFFAMLFLTVVVWFYMYAKRIPFILSYIETHKITDSQELGKPGSKHNLAVVSPESVRSPSDNLKNLFEVPILFYALVMYLFVTNQVDDLYLTAAWGHVIFRYLHSIIHCTVNKVELRFQIYVVSCIILYSMMFRAGYSYFLNGVPE